MLKKILMVFLLLIAIAIGVFVWFYITDTFEIKKLVSYQIARVPYVSDALKLDTKYIIENLKRKEPEPKAEPEKYEIKDIECSLKESPVKPHDGRYLEAFIIPKETEVASDEEGENIDEAGQGEDLSYPYPNNQDYSQEDLEYLASVYSSMEADQAVKILEQFDDQVIIDILSNMKTGKVAEIMSIFDPKRAGVISLKILDSDE